MIKKDKSLLEIHIAVILFGMAGLFGKLISLSSIVIVFGRVFSSSIFLFILLSVLKQKIKLPSFKDYIKLILLGLMLSIHWITFFKSIQLSTVAIGLLTFSSFPIFVTFLEPLFFKEKVLPIDILLALVTFLGIMLVVGNTSAESNILFGALMGLLSGFTYAILSILNKKYVSKYSSIVISFYEQGAAALVLAPFVIFQHVHYTNRNLFLIILLGIIFTAVAHSLFINGLKNVKVQNASIISSLEPVYGIVFSALLLNEIPNLKTIIGGTIILIASIYSSKK